jgi:uncharacterized membrane protein
MSVSLSSVRFVAPRGGSSASLQAVSALQTWPSHWSFHRALSFSPRQMNRVCFGLCVGLAGLTLADVAWMMADLWPLFGLTMALLIWATLAWSRHAADCDVIALRPDLLRVERHRGGQVERTEFNPRWVRVEPTHDDRSLICLSGGGKRVSVGAFVQRAQRRRLADEIRWALRQASR